MLVMFVYTGTVPDEESTANSDPESDPFWGLELIFSKPVTITYGPWVDKQRLELYSYC